MLKILATLGAVILGGTFAISALSKSAIQYSNTKKREKHGRPCRTCKGRGFHGCKLCRASGTIKWSPLYDPVYINPCLCPTCDGLKVQHCLNCLGYGSV